MHLIKELFRCHREEKSLNLYQNSYSKTYQQRSDGFVKGRFIRKDSTLINIIIDNAAEQQIPRLLLFIDFKGVSTHSSGHLLLKRTLESYVV